MVIKLNKKNPFTKELYSKKFKLKIVKPKKGKGSFKRKKKIDLFDVEFFNFKLSYINVETYYYSIFI